ncbi:MAG TPA: hypothetical protein VFX33_00085 [Actinomycetales bacterium]|nr:hypothetical protein [Actinomycetales bacterium]
MPEIGFEIRVVGVVPPGVLRELGELEIDAATLTTVLAGVVPDQAALVGMLDRLRSMGLEVAEFRRVPTNRSPEEDVEAGGRTAVAEVSDDG